MNNWSCAQLTKLLKLLELKWNSINLSQFRILWANIELFALFAPLVKRVQHEEGNQQEMTAAHDIISKNGCIAITCA